MTFSPAGSNWLKGLEGGFIPNKHLVFGVPHIGYGFNLEYHDLPDPITKAQADAYFDQLTGQIGNYLNNVIPGVNQCLFDAATAFVYNVGHLPDVLINAINTNDPDLFDIWQNIGTAADGNNIPGLVARRKKEIEWAKGCHSNGSGALVVMSIIAILFIISKN